MTQDIASEITLLDLHPPADTFREHVLQGMGRTPKALPCKYFYDGRGSRLFERICGLDEYYPTRTEMAIMQRHAGEMAELAGPACLIVEYGSGSSTKTRILLDHLKEPAAYVPIDISRDHLLHSATQFARRYRDLEVLPVCADFNTLFDLPVPKRAAAKRVVYFPGSTIGNFAATDAARLLGHIAAQCGSDGGLLVGIDLKKDRAILEAAYNDHLGVTAEFNLNLLVRANRELGADFQIEQFRHDAFYNDAAGRIEMHLVSTVDQTVTIGEAAFALKEGETIHTENSHKYTIDEFAGLADRWFELGRSWTDERELFGVLYLECRL